MTSPLRIRGGAKEKRTKVKKVKSSSSSKKEKVVKSGKGEVSQTQS
jgi:hypothetical protein